MSDDDQKLRVRRVGRDGRRRFDPGSKARLVAACLEPGVSISGLALAHGVNANLLRKWVKDARESGLPTVSSRSAFIPVVAADCGRPDAVIVPSASSVLYELTISTGRDACTASS